MIFCRYIYFGLDDGENLKFKTKERIENKQLTFNFQARTVNLHIFQSKIFSRYHSCGYNYCRRELHVRCVTVPGSPSGPFGRCCKIPKIIEEIWKLKEILKISPKQAYKLQPFIYIPCTYIRHTILLPDGQSY